MPFFYLIIFWKEAKDMPICNVMIIWQHCFSLSIIDYYLDNGDRNIMAVKRCIITTTHSIIAKIIYNV